MASVFTQDLRIQNASDFRELISRQISNNRVYFVFGKPTAWNDDELPEQANASVAVFNTLWKNMIGAKLMTGNEVKNVIPRIDWKENTKYDTYNDCMCTHDLFGSDYKFYVVTTDWNVYKCLDNNSDANSTIMPSQTYVDRAIGELDGYVWKYMYTVPQSDRMRFATDAYIPVRTLETSDGTLQWLVQANAIPGAIESIAITNPGSGYTNANNIIVYINGDGFGAEGVARINTVSNTISSVTMSSRGAGYTYGTITIQDITEPEENRGTNAQARIILSPPGGHGSDPVFELGGSYIILNPRLQTSESGKFPVVNEFRQVAMLLNPYESGSAKPASNVAYSQFITVTLDTGITNYLSDEVVYQGGTLDSATFTGVVEQWNSSNNQLILTNTTGTIKSDTLVGANSFTSRYVQSYTNKELESYTGKLLYINNISPISRAEDQTEDFKIVMQF